MAGKVAILMGSASDLDAMKKAVEVLAENGVPHEVRVLSAHRTPERVAEFARSAEANGFKVIIAGAGAAAHLAGAVAANTTLPVIGVPLAGPALNGLDALLATVQMPGGVPVATMAIGPAGAKNAAIFALQILAQSDVAFRARLDEMRKRMAAEVEAADQKVRPASWPGQSGG